MYKDKKRSVVLITISTFFCKFFQTANTVQEAKKLLGLPQISNDVHLSVNFKTYSLVSVC